MTGPAPPSSAPATAARRVLLPDVPVVVADWTNAAVLDSSGERSIKSAVTAAQRIAASRPIVCHAPALAARLKTDPFPTHDVL